MNTHTAYTGNENFYPTPKSVIAKMIAPFKRELNKYDGHRWQILDPEAGQGDILDYLTDELHVKPAQLYGIELDPELVYTLQGKGHKVIYNDFLSYQGDYLFDLILMNPPFDRGDDHLLKAWEVLQTGHIACLLNEETVLNLYSAKRKLLKSIIDEHGSIEFLGACFTDARRQTNVRVALVRLEKKETAARFSFDFGQTQERSYDLTEEIAGDQLALNDLTGAMLRQYEKVKGAYVDYIKAKKALSFYSKGLIGDYTSIGEMADKAYSSQLSAAYNGFMDEFKSSAWSRIIEKLGMAKFMTAGVLKDFNKFKKSQGAMDLTRENIFALINMIVDNRVSILDRAVVDVFDIFTKYHEENRLHVEGWKTNSAWKVNRKIILPYWVKYGQYISQSDLKQWGDHFRLDYKSEYDDIDKVMCYLTGKDYNKSYTLVNALSKHFDCIGNVKPGQPFNNSGESEFFTFKFWKKGTLHIEFKDVKLWEEFNYRACLGKNFLPTEERKRQPKPQAQPAMPSNTAIALYGAAITTAGPGTQLSFF